MKSYNKSNLFFKIIHGEIPCKKILENNNAMSFFDINPKALVHFLVIPKNEFTDFYDFQNNGSSIEKNDFWNCLNESVKQLNLEQKGFRLISNCGEFANQEIPHFHVHVLGGEKLSF